MSTDPALLNGKPKCTLIESFPGEVFVIRPGFKKDFERDLKKALVFIAEQGWELNIEIIKGSPILRRIQR